MIQADELALINGCIRSKPELSLVATGIGLFVLFAAKSTLSYGIHRMRISLPAGNVIIWPIVHRKSTMVLSIVGLSSSPAATADRHGSCTGCFGAPSNFIPIRELFLIKHRIYLCSLEIWGISCMGIQRPARKTPMDPKAAAGPQRRDISTNNTRFWNRDPATW